MISIAAFDFDGTLIHGDSTGRLVRALLGFRIWRVPCALSWIMRMRIAKDAEALQWAKCGLIGCLIRGLEQRQVESRIAHAASDIRRRWRMPILSELQRHLDQGHHVVIVTASPTWLVGQLFQDKPVRILGSEFETRQGRFTGQLLGSPCHGEEKVERLESFRQGLPEESRIIHAFGDSKHDVPMLRLAERFTLVQDGP